MLTERHQEILRDWRDDLRSGRAFGEAWIGHEDGRKLSDADVRAIRSDQRRHALIAADYNISLNYVGMIKSRARRANVFDIPEAAE